MQFSYLFPSVLAVGNIPDFSEVLGEFKSNTDAIDSYLQPNIFNDNVSATNKTVPCLVKELNLFKTKQVMDELFQKYKQNIPKFKNCSMVMYQSWLNVTSPGGFQDMHTHSFDELVGCFYLNVPVNSGNIEFAPVVEQASIHRRETIKPYTGMYAFFPGSILHRVTYNRSSLQRISFSFNYKIKHDLV